MLSLSEKQANKAGYTLLGLKAIGGSAAIYKARHKSTRKLVALKVLHPTGNPLHIHREARALSALQHPNVAQVIEVGQIEDTSYLATQWIEGKTLHELVQTSIKSEHATLDIDLSLQLVRGIADALQYAHCKGIIHGDINPNNILVSAAASEAILIDFGIGRARYENTVTAVGELAGTPRYLAPELIKGEALDAASDQYALALVAFELLTGRWPFAQRKPVAAEALHHQLYSPPALVTEIRPDLPEPLNPVFATALSKSPSQRFSDVWNFYEAFSQAVRLLGDSSSQRASLTHNPDRMVQRAKRNLRFAPLQAIAIPLAVSAGIVIPTSQWLPADEQNHQAPALYSEKKPAIETQALSVSMPLVANIADPAKQSQSKALKVALTPVQPTAITCNLYTNSGFDRELEDNFFRDANYPQLATRIEHPEVISSPALQLGNIDVYGTYGVIVKVVGGRSYVFAADLFFRQYVHRMEMSIIWLDERWRTIEDQGEKLVIERKFDGSFLLSNAIAPKTAHYAVPTLYKDASSGIVYADNLIFAPVNQSC